MKDFLCHIILSVAFLILVCNPAYAASNKAILIGISQYADPDINCLAYADEDVKTFSSILTNFAGYDSSDIITLLNQKATKDNILKTITNAVNSSQKNPLDHFILMFAGHGLPPNISSNTTNSFLAPYDAIRNQFYRESRDSSLANNETFVNKAWLTKQLSTIKAKSIILILDSCYSGARNFGELFAENLGFNVGFAGGKDTDRGVVIVQKKNSLGPLESRIAFIASSNEDQPSAEYQELKHGALSYCIFEFINAVRKATDDSRREEITIGSMYSNIRTLFDKVEVKGSPLSAIHQPVLFALPNYDDVSSMMFISIQGEKKPKVKKGMLEIVTDPEGAEVSVDGVQTGKKSNLRLELTEGKHIISLFIPATNYNHNFIVDIKEGYDDRIKISLRGSLEVESYTEKWLEKAPKLTVYVDNKFLGETGLVVKDLLAGTHVLKVSAENVTKERHIEIRPASPLLVRYRIIREAAPKTKDPVGPVVF